MKRRRPLEGSRLRWLLLAATVMAAGTLLGRARASRDRAQLRHSLDEGLRSPAGIRLQKCALYCVRAPAPREEECEGQCRALLERFPDTDLERMADRCVTGRLARDAGESLGDCWVNALRVDVLCVAAGKPCPGYPAK